MSNREAIRSEHPQTLEALLWGVGKFFLLLYALIGAEGKGPK